VKSPPPLVIDKLRRIAPRLSLPVESAIGPRLMRVAGEQKPFVHTKPTIVPGQGIRGSV